MINVSNTLKNACNSSEPIEYREFIIIDEQEIDIKGNLSANAYTDNTFFGTFNMKILEFEAENNIDFKEKEFDYYKEVNGEAFKIGRFIVTEIKDSNTYENVIVTAYDYGLKFATKYKSDLNFKSGNITFKQYIDEICIKCGVELKNEHLVGENVIIQESPEGTDVQFGNAIAYGAGFQGTFATINQDNQLEFILENHTEQDYGILLKTENNEYITTENDYILETNEPEIIEDYIELDDKRDTRPITCVLVAIDEDSIQFGATAKDQALIKKYGENWLKIIGNPLIRSTQKCIEVAPLILNNVKGFGYTAFESKYTFKPYLTLGDVVKLRRNDGTLVKSNILRITTEYDSITLQAPSIINASVEYEPIMPDNKINDALINIDKANSQIVLKATADGYISKVSLGADVSTGSSFNVLADNINFNGKTFDLTTENLAITSTNFSVDKNGNMTANSGTFGGTLNTSQNCTVGNNLYVGQNQVSSGVDLKYIYFNTDNYIKRVYSASAKGMEMWGKDLSRIRVGNSTVEALDDQVKMETRSGGYFYINGTLVHSSSSIIVDSDKKLKTDIEDVDVDWIDNLDIKQYKYKTDLNTKHIGIIAQDYIDKDGSEFYLRQYEQDGEDYYGVAYGNITTALIKYCQELKKTINKQQEDIDLLKQQINSIINKEDN